MHAPVAPFHYTMPAPIPADQAAAEPLGGLAHGLDGLSLLSIPSNLSLPAGGGFGFGAGTGTLQGLGLDFLGGSGSTLQGLGLAGGSGSTLQAMHSLMELLAAGSGSGSGHGLHGNLGGVAVHAGGAPPTHTPSHSGMTWQDSTPCPHDSRAKHIYVVALYRRHYPMLATCQTRLMPYASPVMCCIPPPLLRQPQPRPRPGPRSCSCPGTSSCALEQPRPAACSAARCTCHTTYGTTSSISVHGGSSQV